MATLKFTPDAATAYANLDNATTAPLLDAIDDALDLLEADPGDKRCRARAFGDGLWGIPVRSRFDDWLIIWNKTKATMTSYACVTSAGTPSRDRDPHPVQVRGALPWRQVLRSSQRRLSRRFTDR